MKKLVKYGMAMLLFLTMSVSTVFAVGSATANGAVTGVSGVAEGVTVSFATDADTVFEDVTPEAAAQIESLNSETSLEDALADVSVQLPEGTTIDLAEFSLLTRLQDLVALNPDGTDANATNVTVTWEVPNLTSNMGEVYVLHYSTVRNVWEVIEPSNVDFNKLTVTATFPDLSPVAVIYKQSDGTATGDSSDTTTTTKEESAVKTGDNTNIALYAGLGGAAIIALGLLAYRSKKAN